MQPNWYAEDGSVSDGQHYILHADISLPMEERRAIAKKIVEALQAQEVLQAMAVLVNAALKETI